MQRGGALCPLRKRRRRGSPSLVSNIHIWGDKSQTFSYIIRKNGNV